ncbi:hypothetical protein [Tropicibacter alexandrii]|uniref:hypothetical protein n=1 Tax=Tropicibacter alexandrii TaxID=2267683 RepID=UPI000EF49C9E|nr:hypothetical protein [Tropicibacter alexandrii]
MKPAAIIGAVVAVLVIGFAFYMIDIDQTQEAQLPEVTVEGGQAPEFDAEVGDVDVDSETVEVEVPTLDVEPPKDD